MPHRSKWCLAMPAMPCKDCRDGSFERWGHRGPGPTNARPPEQPECMERCDTSTVAAQPSWAIRENMPIVRNAGRHHPHLLCCSHAACNRFWTHECLSRWWRGRNPRVPVGPSHFVSCRLSRCVSSIWRFLLPQWCKCAKSQAWELLKVLILLLGPRPT